MAELPTIADLWAHKFERTMPADASAESVMFFVGRDDLHNAMKAVLGAARQSVYLNMFGFDDEELNDLLMALVRNPAITMLVTLDKSQSGGVHEKRLLDADRQQDLADFNTHFVIGQSATHSISHTKGFVVDGLILCHGSTNWSTDGEGIWTKPDGPGGVGFKAQNNTQEFNTNPCNVRGFQTELLREHQIAAAQGKRKGN